MAKNSAVKPARVVTLRARAVAKIAANVRASGGVFCDKTKPSSYRKINGLTPKGNRPKLKTRNGSRCIFCSKAQYLYLSKRLMKLLTPIHVVGAALFFSMVSNSHGQDALIPLAKRAPDDRRSAFNSPSQPTGGKIPFLSRWLSAVGPKTQVCQDGTVIDPDDGGLVSQVPS